MDLCTDTSIEYMCIRPGSSGGFFFDFVKEGSILLFQRTAFSLAMGRDGVYVYKLVHSKCKVQSG